MQKPLDTDLVLDQVREGSREAGLSMATLAMDAGSRTVSIGRIFERAMNTIVHNPLATIGLSLFIGTIPSVLGTWLGHRLLGMNGAEDFTLALVVGWLVIMALSLVISAVLVGVFTTVTSAEADGAKLGFGQALSRTLPVILPLILFSILFALALVVGIMLLIIPGIMLYLAYSVGAPALVAERLNVGAAFKRSRVLTKGARLKIFALFLVLFVVLLLMSGAFELAGVETVDTPGVRLTPMTFVAAVISGTVMNVLWSSVQASLYIELRNWKDGPQSDHLQDVFA